MVWPFSEKAGSYREEKIVDFPEAFDALEEGFAIIDKEHNIILANKTLADMVGMPRYSVEGSKCYQVIHNANTPVLSCPHIRSLERKRITSMTAKEPKLGSGTYQFNASPVIGSDGNLRYFVYTIRNVSELEEIRSDLLENKKRWQLLFNKGTDAMFVIGLKEDGRPG
ncbi:PAS domain S-box protein, partial [bacterium]|nr:PAS domain S-box protein [bacterium]NIO73676.1 PAS domain S-box protein [bacterium]